MKNQIREKLVASGKHLAISIVVIAFSLTIIRYLWYPDQLFEVMLAGKIFSILAITDITIGPALTFIIYNRKKNNLRKDLFVIALIQATALAVGIKTLAEARPIWIVYNYGIFDIVRANEALAESTSTLPKTPFLKISWLGPKFVSAKLPDNNHERTKILFDTLSGKPDISKNPKYFVPIEAAWEEIKSIAKQRSAINNREIYALPVTGSAAPSIAIIEKNQNPKIKIVKEY